MAHKKAAGSTKNLKDSKPKYRGVKVFGGQKVIPGNIIIRQNGNKFECGKNVYMGRDFTILSEIAGVVTFKKKKFKRFDGRVYLKTVVEVFPLTETDTLIETVKVTKAVKTTKPVAKPAKLVVKQVVAEETPVEKKTPVKKATAEKKEIVKKVPVKKATAEKKETVKKTPVKKTTKKVA
ncbi:MAG: 50S ribosomal protein L27 [Candidatus Absconditicoccaceae bacterium]